MERILLLNFSFANFNWVTYGLLIQYVHYPVYTVLNRSATIAVLNIHFIYQKCFNTSSCLNESSLSLRGRSWSVVLHFFFLSAVLYRHMYIQFQTSDFWEPSIHNTIIFYSFHCFIQVHAVPFSGCFFDDPLDITQ